MSKRVLILAALGRVLAAPLLAGAEEATLTPPEVVERRDATYPQAALEARQEGTVVLLLTVAADGAIGEVVVAESAGAALDQAATEALRGWRFRPARRGGQAVASRIRVPFRFALPPPAPTPLAIPPAPAPPPTSPAPPSGPPTKGGEETLMEVTVRGQRPPPPRGVSDFRLERDLLVAAPHGSAAELLTTAPGVYVSRPEGDAVAHQIFLRGFDAEHGQDIELTVGGLPINQPSHIHGQGYADLNFIIPETVRTLRVTEGVYDPRQGDFAVAGSIDFDLGVAERGLHARTSYGSFNTFRQLALWAPRGQAEETFAAFELRRSDGFGKNRGSLAGGAIAQYAFERPGGLRGLVHASAYAARASLAGVLRWDDVNADRVGFYDSYADPSASAQSAFSLRAQGAFSLEHLATNGARTSLALWLLFTDFRQRINFTGYTQRALLHPEWVGRGDLTEQGHRDLAFGARSAHRTRRFNPTSWLQASFEIGLALRADFIDQTQALLQVPDNQTWDQRVDASVRSLDVGLYGDVELKVTRYLQLRGGLRVDGLYFDVDDRLGNYLTSSQQQTHLQGYRRTAAGIAFGPRATVEVSPLRWLAVVAAYGEGYRSPQARQLAEGEEAPFAKVRAGEVGLRLRAWDDRLVATAAGFATFLAADLAFDPGAARLERIGPTSRLGVAGQVVARPWPFLLTSLSLTWVRATLDAPPPATAENPAPPYTPGQLLPYVPPIVLRFDAAAQGRLFSLRGLPVEGRAGVGFSLLSPRPLPFGKSAAAVYLLDASLGARLRWVELGLEVQNLLDLRYAATEYSFVSDWNTRAAPSLLPARHLSAGAPRTFLGTLALHF